MVTRKIGLERVGPPTPVRENGWRVKIKSPRTGRGRPATRDSAVSSWCEPLAPQCSNQMEVGAKVGREPWACPRRVVRRHALPWPSAWRNPRISVEVSAEKLKPAAADELRE